MIEAINSLLHSVVDVVVFVVIWTAYKNSQAHYQILGNRIDWLERRMDRKESNADA